MIFTPTSIRGAYVVEPERLEDERGFFARTWCEREFREAGLDPRVVQCNISFNGARGTLRGLHWQARPHEEAKLVRCTQGAIHDVIVDLRPNSPSYTGHFAIELSSTNRKALYVPGSCAHGFLTLEEDTEVFYQMSEFYVAEAARGVRWNDPAFGIEWPEPVRVISERDASYPDYEPVALEREG